MEGALAAGSPAHAGIDLEQQVPRMIQAGLPAHAEHDAP
jgi:hypothetical protein